MNKNDCQTTAAKGAMVYFARLVSISGFTFLTNILLNKYLTPDEYSKIVAIQLFYGFLQIFCDGGFGVYLVQKSEVISHEYQSQLCNVQLTIYCVLHIAITAILVAYDRSIAWSTTRWMLWVCMFSIPIGILKANNIVLLERALKFNNIAAVDIAETVVYAAICMATVLAGWGCWAFVIAIIARGLVGLFIADQYAHFKLLLKRPKIDRDVVCALKYGVYYHAPTIINQVRLGANPIVVGFLLNAEAVANIDRAAYWAGVPIFVINSIQQKILFPVISRYKNHTNEVAEMLKNSAFLGTCLSQAMCIPVFIYAEEIVKVLFGQPWIGMVPLLRINIVANAIFGGYSGTMMPLFNAIGEAKVNYYCYLISLGLTAICIVPALHYWGTAGYAYIGVLLWLIPTLWMNQLLKKSVFRKDLLTGIYSPTCAMVATVLICVGMKRIWSDNQASVASLIFHGSISICLYFVILGIWERKNIKDYLFWLKKVTP